MLTEIDLLPLMPENLNELLKRIINPFIFGNIIIALCSLSLFLETYLQLQMPVKSTGLGFLVFFATLALYNMHRLLVIARRQPVDYSITTAWGAKHRFTLFMLSIIGAGGVAFFVFQTSLPIFGVLVLLGSISLLYELPLVREGKRFHGFRNFWIHKAFMITTVWTLATALLPVLNTQRSLLDIGIWLVLAERMLYIFMLALCFDARDVAFDAREGLKTIPIRYGPIITQRLYQLISIVLILTAGIHYFILTKSYGTGIAMILSTGITYLVIAGTGRYKSDYYYIFMVDGMMVLQFLLIALLNALF